MATCEGARDELRTGMVASRRTLAVELVSVRSVVSVLTDS